MNAAGPTTPELNFTDEPLSEIVGALRARLETLPPTERLSFYALDPDLSAGCYNGERTEHAGVRYRHRSLLAWLELADRLGCRLGTPERVGERIKLSVSKLKPNSWQRVDHADRVKGEVYGDEVYGPKTAFSRVQKLEEPTFWLDYTDALARVALGPGARVLSLGVGRGDELEPLAAPGDVSFTGVDHSAGALEVARERFPGPNYRFIQADLNALAGLELGRFELVISVATLQSPGVADHALLRNLVQHHLSERGSVVLALPNCRYEDGAVRYGAKLKNFTDPDLSLVLRDGAFYRKYLQQHRFRVFVTGKYYLFITGVRG